MFRLKANAGKWAATETRSHTDQVLFCQQPCNAKSFYDVIGAIKPLLNTLTALTLLEARVVPNQRLVKKNLVSTLLSQRLIQSITRYS
jgi:hypothetical protein